MAEGIQGEFLFVDGWDGPDGDGGQTPSVSGEIARIWKLPIGEQVEVTLAKHALPGTCGRLEVAKAPEYPFDPRKQLRLRIGHAEFSSSQIVKWQILD
ncbi:MAG: hypothetical protein EA425_17650 [Puniceicoccaceae bacterium]|nr:MAG: hypothetical protein EA425_17650 [Puniceicoccaceae bacterium]